MQRTPAHAGPLGTPMPRMPYATYALIAINVVVFLLCAVQGTFGDPGSAPLFEAGDLVKSDVHLGDYWRLLTAGFLHFSVIHVAVNMISLYILGRELEMVLGTARFVAVYVISLFGGSAAVMLFEQDGARTAGASGAIYGLMGAMLIIVLKLRLSPVAVLSIIGFNVVLSFTLPGISVLGHLGGLAFGAAATAALVYLPGLVSAGQRRPASAAAGISWVALGVLLVLAIALGVGAAVAYSGPIYAHP